MRINEDGTHTYSHTSLSLWRLCHRRWFNRYILGIKEPQSIAAAWSVHMVHRPCEYSLACESDVSEKTWLDCFDSFRKEIGIPDYVDDLHTVGTGKLILERIRQSPPALSDCSAENQSMLSFSALTSYSTRPDLVGTRDGRRFTVDWKYTERKWKTAQAPWPVKALLAYDDQLLGQAIVSEADGFVRGTIAVEPSSGKISGPLYEERLVDGQLRKEWLAETKSTINQIEACLHDLNFEGKKHEPTPVEKNTDSCYAFGKECCYKKICTGGFKNAKRSEPR